MIKYHHISASTLDMQQVRLQLRAWVVLVMVGVMYDEPCFEFSIWQRESRPRCVGWDWRPGMAKHERGE